MNAGLKGTNEKAIADVLDERQDWMHVYLSARHLLSRETSVTARVTHLGLLNEAEEALEKLNRLWTALAAEDRLTKAGHSLGEVVSRVFTSHRAEDAGYEDIRLFGAPSECGIQVAVTGRKWERQALAEFGLTPDEYTALLDLRGDAKQAYQLGLYLRDCEA